MQLITSLAVLATATGTAQALGKAIIYNKCDVPVYLWPTDSDRAPTEPLTVAAGSSWSEGYQVPSSGGVSVKISKTTSCASGIITQLEYTIPGTGQMFYDGSNVDCDGKTCPFWDDGMFLETSDSSCPTRVCNVGEVTCTGFYTYFNNDVNTVACDDSADTILYLCATSADGTSSPAASSLAVAVSSLAVAVSSAAPVKKLAISSSLVALPTSISTSIPTSLSTTIPTTVPTTSATSVAPISTSLVIMNEAPVTTFVTFTRTEWEHTRPSKRAEHAHARRHGHQH